jgi:hypothetical protein
MAIHRSVVACAAIISAAAVAPTRSSWQEPTLEQVLARAAAYVVKHYEKVSGIVAEETYQQDARDLQRGVNRPIAARQRTLKSDLLLVKPPDADRYVEFRDVFEVNGMGVRDRQERLTKLFLTPTQASVDQIKAIVNESARHNVGNVMRNVNTPMLSLHFLLPQAQKRFRFRQQRNGTPQLGTATEYPGRDASQFLVPAGAWILEYRETSKPTLVKTEGGADFPVTGRFWIEPVSGAVLLSEIVLRNTDLLAIIDVAYQPEPVLGIRVPMEMRERYRTPEERVEGVATYARFRQFQVKTDTNIVKPPGGLQ